MPEHAIAKRPKPSNFTDAEVELGLRVLAACSGNSRRAAAELEAQGLSVDQATLFKWRKRMPEHYERIQEQVMPAVYAQLAENFESFIHEAGAAEQEFLARLREKKDELPPKELSNALRNVSVAKGISTQRAMDMRGLPTRPTIQPDVTDLLERFRRQYSDVVGFAREVTPSSLPSPATGHNPQTHAPAQAPTSSSDKHQDPKQSA